MPAKPYLACLLCCGVCKAFVIHQQYTRVVPAPFRGDHQCPTSFIVRRTLYGNCSHITDSPRLREMTEAQETHY